MSKKTPPNVTYCLIAKDPKKSYVGSTCDLPHRLRQHNAEISGGASTTRNYVKHLRKEAMKRGVSEGEAVRLTANTWFPLFLVTWHDEKKYAAQLESCLKHTRPSGGKKNPFGNDAIARRTHSLFKSVHSKRFTRSAPLTRSQRLTVSWSSHLNMQRALNQAPYAWPENVTHRMNTGGRTLGASGGYEQPRVAHDLWCPVCKMACDCAIVVPNDKNNKNGGSHNACPDCSAKLVVV